ncbi:uncharacterized protein LOC100899984 [Galendromus occidentalis]|uniref:Uncharacterized protein LOC100899984 n=1 Tax=Galendromus occidentalis TaxID=34638 RepID=A0AAJ6VYL5_9ACAR|nr:uncharacterized protein LOC100899984 [Galendromus occidentalis]
MRLVCSGMPDALERMTSLNENLTVAEQIISLKMGILGTLGRKCYLTGFDDQDLKFSLGLPVKPGCDPDKLDACGSELVIFGTGQRIPETREQLEMQCRVERAAEICARDFAKECLPPLPRGMVIVILEGISQEVTWKCDANHSLHQAFLRHAPCMNKIGDTLHKCMTNLTSKLDFSAGVEPHQRVSRSCCNFQEYIDCSHRAVERSCGKEAGEYIRKLLTRSAGDFIEIACVSHKTDGPACKKINSLSPNQLSNRIGQLNEVNSNRSMSLLSPMAKLVTAEG